MERTVLTPQALGMEELHALLEAETLEHIYVGQRIRAINSEIAARIAEQQRIEIDARLADPTSIEDLLIDPSYNDDDSFEPSIQDQERLSAYSLRHYTLRNAKADIQKFENTISSLTYLLQNGDSRIAEMQAQIAGVNSSNWQRIIAKFVTDPRPGLQAEIASLKRRIAEAPKILDEATVALERAQQSVIGIPEDEPYDVATLHGEDMERIGTLSRMEQSVLVTFDGDATFTLRMPRTFGEQDFGRSITFLLQDYDDIDLFMSILGQNIRVDSGIFRTVGENIDRRYEFDDEMIPLALDVVEFQGEQHYRLPQVLLEKFGSSIV